jgi:hypothetical protein
MYTQIFNFPPLPFDLPHIPVMSFDRESDARLIPSFTKPSCVFPPNEQATPKSKSVSFDNNIENRDPLVSVPSPSSGMRPPVTDGRKELDKLVRGRRGGIGGAYLAREKLVEVRNISSSSSTRRSVEPAIRADIINNGMLGKESTLMQGNKESPESNNLRNRIEESQPSPIPMSNSHQSHSKSSTNASQSIRRFSPSEINHSRISNTLTTPSSSSTTTPRPDLSTCSTLIRTKLDSEEKEVLSTSGIPAFKHFLKQGGSIEILPSGSLVMDLSSRKTEQRSDGIVRMKISSDGLVSSPFLRCIFALLCLLADKRYLS